MNRFGQRGVIPPEQNRTLLPGVVESATLSSVLLPEATLTFTPALILPALTATPASYQLLIVRAGDGNSIVVFNQSADVFPLNLLQLGKGNSALSGASWGVDNLNSGECVGAWKAGEAQQVPGGINCHLVGNQRELKKKDLLGDGAFAVYYNGKQVGTCDRNQNQCWIKFIP